MDSSVSRSAPGLVLFVTTLASFSIAFAASSVNVALPPLGLEFGLGGVALNWVVTAYVLTSAALIMPMGRLGDKFGRQGAFKVGMAVFCLASLGSALAPGAAWLFAFRAVGGLAASMAFGTVTAVLVSAYPPEKRGQILGINVAVIYFGQSIGPVLGGILVQAFGWRGVFGFHFALSLGVILVMTKLRGNDIESRSGRFDFPGALLYALGLGMLLTGFSNLPSALGIGLGAGGALVLAGFWVFESRAKSPILPVRLFTGNRTFGFSNLAAMISYSATFSVAFFLSLYLEVVRGLPPYQAGLFLVAQPMVQAPISPVTGRLSDRIPPLVLASAGMGLTALGLGGLAFLGADTPLGWVLAFLILLGFGFALFSSPNTNAIMGSVERKDLGLASATVATMRIVGQMLSMGLALGLMSLLLGSAEVGPATSGLYLGAQHWGFGIASVLCAVGIAASLARNTPDRKRI